jgi:hypothetical protein
MRCLRCQGTMVEEWMFTEKEGGTSIARCLNCGDIVDNVVIFNRLHALGTSPKKPGKKIPRSSTYATSV